MAYSHRYPTNIYSVGRDKFLRTLQYFSRFYAWYLYRTNHAQTAIAPFEAVKKQFGLARKLMRLGKFVEHFKAAAQAADAKAMDPVLRYCAVGRQLGYAGYMLLDNLTVPDAIGARKSASIKTLQKEAYRMWLAGLTFNVAAGLYTLYKLRERSQTVEKSADAEKVVESKKLRLYVNMSLDSIGILLTSKQGGQRCQATTSFRPLRLDRSHLRVGLRQPRRRLCRSCGYRQFAPRRLHCVEEDCISENKKRRRSLVLMILKTLRKRSRRKKKRTAYVGVLLVLPRKHR